MKKGNRARLLQLERRGTAAQAIGHSVLDSAAKRQAEVCQTVLAGEIEPHSRSDLLLAMWDQCIDPGPFRTEFEREIAAENERVLRAQEAARLARQELASRKLYKENEDQFKKWLLERTQVSGKKSPDKDLNNDE